MDLRSFESGAAASPPSAPASPSAGHPTNGNPSTATPATTPGEYWFYQIGEELRYVLTEAGLTPSNSTLTQLKSALDTLYGSSESGIKSVSASVAANALTLTIPAQKLSFRSSTLGSGTVNSRTIASPISVVVSSGSTLGTSNGVAARLAVIAIDNAGTVEAAVVNLAGGLNLDESTLISTTAEGGAGAADSASVIYSTAARSNVPFRVVGVITLTQATAGTWVTAPSSIQGTGGLVLSAMGGASLSTSGYQMLPSGLIIQWGQATVNTNPSFPIAFTSACYSVVCSPDAANNGGGQEFATAYNFSTTSFSVAGDYAGTAYWIAIGK